MLTFHTSRFDANCKAETRALKPHNHNSISSNMVNCNAIDLHEQTTGDGAILFDRACLPQAAEFCAEWFDREYWREQGAAADQMGGRGGVTFIDAPLGLSASWVLRHYRRGGMAARVLGDRYLWCGAEHTRSFAEFRLLAELQQRGLDVSRPVAARYRRSGTYYRADLITLQIADVQTLAELIAGGSADTSIAQRVGMAIARLHAVNADHADLNAHNILIDAGKVWLIDFDRGRLRAPQRAWQQANLARLKRSLLKIGAAKSGEAQFDQTFWQPLLIAYQLALATSPVNAASAR